MNSMVYRQFKIPWIKKFKTNNNFKINTKYITKQTNSSALIKISKDKICEMIFSINCQKINC